MDSVLLTMSHGQRIRCMSNPELAEFMIKLVEGYCDDDLRFICGTTCRDCTPPEFLHQPCLKRFKDWLDENVLTQGCLTCSLADDCHTRYNDEVIEYGYCPHWVPKSLGQDDWVPCDLALPPTPDEYLVTTESGKCCVAKFHRSLSIGGAPYFSGDEKVVAWRVLPSAYKVKEDKGDAEK